jgi:hypothetical protein
MWPRRPEARQHNVVILKRALKPDTHGEHAGGVGGVRGKQGMQQGDTTAATHIPIQFAVDRSVSREVRRHSWRHTHSDARSSTPFSDHEFCGSHSRRARRPHLSVALRPIARLAQPAPVPRGDLVPSRASYHVTLPSRLLGTVAVYRPVAGCGRVSPRRMKERAS